MGVISVSLPADGSTADVQDYNNPITTIVNAINGNLDSTNISSLSGTKITAGTIPGSALDSNTTKGYITGLNAPNTITALGNRSYSMVFNGVDYTSVLSPGMRLQTTRTVPAPIQSTSLNGTTQYYSKTSPAGMTFTDTVTASAWIKLASYSGTQAHIIARRPAGIASGWNFSLTSSGQVQITGLNGANFRDFNTYQSIPLNKWVHVVATMQMSTATALFYIDGVLVPSTGTTTGSPSSLVQSTADFTIGSGNGGANYFPGKIAQAAVYSSVLSAATILASMHQTLAGTETSLISAYSFNNTINDLNTTNANNLTANGSAVATNADSPFGGQAGGTISSTLDYGIVQSVAFSTNTTVTVQVPEGCTIPTSGGVSAVSYSSNKAPYGFPAQKEKWRVNYIYKTQNTITSSASFAVVPGVQLVAPIGSWEVGYIIPVFILTATSVGLNFNNVSQAGLSNTASDISMQSRTDNPTAALGVYVAVVRQAFTFSTAQTYLLYSLAGASTGGITGTTSLAELYAENTLL